MPADDATSGRMLFEGRWIEAAAQQKRAELLARRAHKEAEAYVQGKHGPAARIAPYGDPGTVVTTLDRPDTFLVMTTLSTGGGGPRAGDVVYEVRRIAEGRWEAVPLSGEP